MFALRYSPRPQYVEVAEPWYVGLLGSEEAEGWRELARQIGRGDAHAPHYLADNGRMGMNAVPIDLDLLLRVSMKRR